MWSHAKKTKQQIEASIPSAAAGDDGLENIGTCWTFPQSFMLALMLSRVTVPSSLFKTRERGKKTNPAQALQGSGLTQCIGQKVEDPCSNPDPARHVFMSCSWETSNANIQHTTQRQNGTYVCVLKCLNLKLQIHWNTKCYGSDFNGWVTCFWHHPKILSANCCQITLTHIHIDYSHVGMCICG